MECSKSNTVVIILIADVYERIIVGRRVLKHILVRIWLLRGIIENRLINSWLVSLISNVMLVISSISLVELLVAILLRLILLSISIRADHLMHILVQLRR